MSLTPEQFARAQRNVSKFVSKTSAVGDSPMDALRGQVADERDLLTAAGGQVPDRTGLFEGAIRGGVESASTALKTLDAPRAALVGLLSGFAGGDTATDKVDDDLGSRLAAGGRRFFEGLNPFDDKAIGVGDLAAFKVDDDNDSGWTEFGKEALAFGGDTLLDPLTYVTAGMAGVGRKAASKGVQMFAKQALKETADEVGTGTLRGTLRSLADSGATRRQIADARERVVAQLGDDASETAVQAGVRDILPDVDDGLLRRTVDDLSDDELLDEAGQALADRVSEATVQSGPRGARQALRDALGDEVGEATYRRLPLDYQGGLRASVPLTREVRDAAGNRSFEFAAPFTKSDLPRGVLQVARAGDLADLTRTGRAFDKLNDARSAVRASRPGQAISRNIGRDGDKWAGLGLSLHEQVDDAMGTAYGQYRQWVDAEQVGRDTLEKLGAADAADINEMMRLRNTLDESAEAKLNTVVQGSQGWEDALSELPDEAATKLTRMRELRRTMVARKRDDAARYGLQLGDQGDDFFPRVITQARKDKAERLGEDAADLTNPTKARSGAYTRTADDGTVIHMTPEEANRLSRDDWGGDEFVEDSIQAMTEYAAAMNSLIASAAKTQAMQRAGLLWRSVATNATRRSSDAFAQLTKAARGRRNTQGLLDRLTDADSRQRIVERDPDVSAARAAHRQATTEAGKVGRRLDTLGRQGQRTRDDMANQLRRGADAAADDRAARDAAADMDAYIDQVEAEKQAILETARDLPDDQTVRARATELRATRADANKQLADARTARAQARRDATAATREYASRRDEKVASLQLQLRQQTDRLAETTAPSKRRQLQQTIANTRRRIDQAADTKEMRRLRQRATRTAEQRELAEQTFDAAQERVGDLDRQLDELGQVVTDADLQAQVDRLDGLLDDMRRQVRQGLDPRRAARARQSLARYGQAGRQLAEMLDEYEGLDVAAADLARTVDDTFARLEDARLAAERAADQRLDDATAKAAEYDRLLSEALADPTIMGLTMRSLDADAPDYVQQVGRLLDELDADDVRKANSTISNNVGKPDTLAKQLLANGDGFAMSRAVDSPAVKDLTAVGLMADVMEGAAKRDKGNGLGKQAIEAAETIMTVKVLDNYMKSFRLLATVGSVGPGFITRNVIGGLANATYVGARPADALMSMRIASAISKARETGAKLVKDTPDATQADIDDAVDQVLRKRLAGRTYAGFDAYDLASDMQQQDLFSGNRNLDAVLSGRSGDDQLAGMTRAGSDRKPLLNRTWQSREQRRLAEAAAGRSRTPAVADPDGVTDTMVNWLFDRRRIQKKIDHNEFAEMQLRGTAYLAGVRKYQGEFADLAPAERLAKLGEQGAMYARITQFDYSDLSQLERQVFRNISPFFSWMKFNTALQLRMLAAKPGRANTMLRFYDHMENLTAGEDGEFTSEDLPVWMREQLGWMTNFDLGDGPIALAPELPLMDLNRYFNDPTSGGLNPLNRVNWGEVTGGTSPLLNTAVEAFTDTDTFTGAPLDYDVSAPWYVRPFVNAGVAGYKRGEDGAPMVSVAWENYLNQLLPTLGQTERVAGGIRGLDRFTSDKSRERGGTSIMSRLVPVMRSMTATPRQMQGEQRRRVYESRDVLDRRLDELGITRDDLKGLMERGYTPQMLAEFIAGN